MEVLNNFSAKFTVVDHGFLVSTTKGERFAYETKEALHAAFMSLFGIGITPAAETDVIKVVYGEPVLIIEKRLEPEVRSVADAPVKSDLDQEPGKDQEPKPNLDPEPEPEKQEFTSIAPVERFAWQSEKTCVVGKSQYQRKGDAFHILKEGYPSSMWIGRSDLLHLKRNPDDLKRIADGFASSKRTVLTSFIRDAVYDDGSIATGGVVKPARPKRSVSPWGKKLEVAPYSGKELLFEEATIFPITGLVGERIGKSMVYRKEGSVAITRSGCSGVVYVREERIEELKALDRAGFDESTGSLGDEGQNLLWNCLEDMKDDAMGCFRKISLETRPDQPKLDSISDGYGGE
ncbi:MAG: hypothetical protein WA130_11615 [Candidatus Methanoperedens sp.]